MPTEWSSHDLDRCPHGRHERDVCYGCQIDGHKYNQGNPFLPWTRVGTNLSGKPILMAHVIERLSMFEGDSDE